MDQVRDSSLEALITLIMIYYLHYIYYIYYMTILVNGIIGEYTKVLFLNALDSLIDSVEYL